MMEPLGDRNAATKKVLGKALVKTPRTRDSQRRSQAVRVRSSTNRFRSRTGSLSCGFTA